MIVDRKKIIIVAAILLVIVGGAYLGLRILGLNDDTSQITLYGNIDIREADLGFNVTGRVESMLVDEGDLVEKGHVLAVLESETYDAEYQAASARVNASSAVLDRLLAGSRPEEIQMARADVGAIQADLVEARANLKRTKKLATDDFATQQKLDDNLALVKSLEERLKAAQQQLSLAIEGPRKEDIAEARAKLKAEEAGLALAATRLDYTKLLSKETGIVKTRIVEPGSVVLSNTPVYTVALTDPVWVRTYVSETNLGKIYPGMKARVFTDSHPDKAYEGWIGFISPIAEFTPKTVETTEVRTSLVYRIRVFVKNPDNSLHQGMPVTVKLVNDSSSEKSGDH